MSRKWDTRSEEEKAAHKFKIMRSLSSNYLRSCRYHYGLKTEHRSSMMAVTAATTYSVTKTGIRPLKLIDLPTEIKDKIGWAVLEDHCPIFRRCKRYHDCWMMRLYNVFNYFQAHPRLRSDYLKGLIAKHLVSRSDWVIEGLQSYPWHIRNYADWDPYVTPGFARLGGPAPRASNMHAIATLIFGIEVHKGEDNPTSSTSWTADTGRMLAELLSAKLLTTQISFKQPGLMPLSPEFQQSLFTRLVCPQLVEFDLFGSQIDAANLVTLLCNHKQLNRVNMRAPLPSLYRGDWKLVLDAMQGHVDLKLEMYEGENHLSFGIWPGNPHVTLLDPDCVAEAPYQENTTWSSIEPGLETRFSQNICTVWYRKKGLPWLKKVLGCSALAAQEIITSAPRVRADSDEEENANPSTTATAASTEGQVGLEMEVDAGPDMDEHILPSIEEAPESSMETQARRTAKKPIKLAPREVIDLTQEEAVVPVKERGRGPKRRKLGK